MKGVLIFAVLLGLLSPSLAVADPGCCGGSPSKAVTAITADELKALLASGTKPTVVNVLPPEAYHKAHIAGSINIPLEHLKSLQGALDKNATVVTYCAGPGCSASSMAAAQLSALGFKNVRDYKGGFQEWSAAGWPIEKGDPVRYISREDVKALRESGKPFVLVDVLAPAYYEKSHIEGAINIPLADLEARSGELKKDARIVVYCYNYICQASTQAAEKLASLGFKDVSDYKGGFQEWKEAGLPVAGPATGPAAPVGPTGKEGASSGGCCPSNAEMGCESGCCAPHDPSP